MAEAKTIFSILMIIVLVMGLVLIIWSLLVYLRRGLVTETIYYAAVLLLAAFVLKLYDMRKSKSSE